MWAGFLGLLLLGASPLAAVFLVAISRKSFLVLLTLGSAFFWLLTLYIISAIFRAWAPLPASAGPYAAFVLVAVLIQELARVGVWRFHRLSVRVLNRIAQEQGDALLSLADRFSLALTYGWSHGAVHSAFFFLAWLPFSLGSGTIYTQHCPRMSFFLVGALSTLGFAALLTGGMVLWFDGLERRQMRTAAIAPAAHAAAALLTLLNFADGGCMVSVPLLLAAGAGVAAYAGQVWWDRTTRPAAPPGLLAIRRVPAGGLTPGSINDTAGGTQGSGLER